MAKSISIGGKSLSVPKEPKATSKPKPRGHTKGVTTGLPVSHFCFQLLEQNERLAIVQTKTPLTDPELLRVIIREFRGSQTAESFISGRQNIAQLRNRYHKKNLANLKPIYLSCSYDSIGVRTIDKDKAKELCRKYKIDDKRFV